MSFTMCDHIINSACYSYLSILGKWVCSCGACIEVRGQVAELAFFLSCGSQTSKSDSQVQWQMPLPNETSPQSNTSHLKGE